MNLIACEILYVTLIKFVIKNLINLSAKLARDTLVYFSFMVMTNTKVWTVHMWTNYLETDHLITNYTKGTLLFNL